MNLVWNKVLSITILLIFIPLTSLRTIYKHSPYPVELSIVFLILWGIAIYLLLRPHNLQKAKKYLDNPFIFIILLSLTTIARLYLYPLVEGVGKGATGDDAFFIPINRLLSLEAPYDIKLHDGAPISPGLGWLFINLPFGISHLLPFLVPIYLVVTAYLINKYTESWLLTNLVLILSMSTTIYWSLLGTGHDLVAIAFTLLISFLLVELNIKTSHRWYVIAIIIGCFSTSRIVFIILPFVFLLLHFQYRRRYALKFFTLSLSTALLCHLTGYFTNDWYQPLHLISRGLNNVGTDLIIFGGVSLLLAAAFAYKYIYDDFYSRLITYALVLGTFLSIIATGELRAVNYNFSLWEGLSYLYVASPLVVLAVITTYLKNTAIKRS